MHTVTIEGRPGQGILLFGITWKNVKVPGSIWVKDGDNPAYHFHVTTSFGVMKFAGYQLIHGTPDRTMTVTLDDNGGEGKLDVRHDYQPSANGWNAKEFSESYDKLIKTGEGMKSVIAKLKAPREKSCWPGFQPSLAKTAEGVTVLSESGEKIGHVVNVKEEGGEVKADLVLSGKWDNPPGDIRANLARLKESIMAETNGQVQPRCYAKLPPIPGAAEMIEKMVDSILSTYSLDPAALLAGIMKLSPKEGDIIVMRCPNDGRVKDRIAAFRPIQQKIGCMFVMLPEPLTLEQLDPEAMRAAGWVRAEKLLALSNNVGVVKCGCGWESHKSLLCCPECGEEILAGDGNNIPPEAKEVIPANSQVTFTLPATPGALFSVHASPGFKKESVIQDKETGLWRQPRKGEIATAVAVVPIHPCKDCGQLEGHHPRCIQRRLSDDTLEEANERMTTARSVSITNMGAPGQGGAELTYQGITFTNAGTEPDESVQRDCDTDEVQATPENPVRIEWPANSNVPQADRERLEAEIQEKCAASIADGSLAKAVNDGMMHQTEPADADPSRKAETWRDRPSQL